MHVYIRIALASTKMELLELLLLVSFLLLPLSQSLRSSLSPSLSLIVKDKLEYIFMKLELLFSFLFSIQAKFKCFIFLFFRKHFHFPNKLSSGRLNFMFFRIPFPLHIILSHYFIIILMSFWHIVYPSSHFPPSWCPSRISEDILWQGTFGFF